MAEIVGSIFGTLFLISFVSAMISFRNYDQTGFIQSISSKTCAILLFVFKSLYLPNIMPLLPLSHKCIKAVSDVVVCQHSSSYIRIYFIAVSILVCTLMIILILIASTHVNPFQKINFSFKATSLMASISQTLFFALLFLPYHNRSSDIYFNTSNIVLSGFVVYSTIYPDFRNSTTTEICQMAGNLFLLNISVLSLLIQEIPKSSTIYGTLASMSSFVMLICIVFHQRRRELDEFELFVTFSKFEKEKVLKSIKYIFYIANSNDFEKQLYICVTVTDFLKKYSLNINVIYNEIFCSGAEGKLLKHEILELLDAYVELLITRNKLLELKYLDALYSYLIFSKAKMPDKIIRSLFIFYKIVNVSRVPSFFVIRNFRNFQMFKYLNEHYTNREVENGRDLNILEFTRFDSLNKSISDSISTAISIAESFWNLLQFKVSDIPEQLGIAKSLMDNSLKLETLVQKILKIRFFSKNYLKLLLYYQDYILCSNEGVEDIRYNISAFNSNLKENHAFAEIPCLNVTQKSKKLFIFLSTSVGNENRMELVSHDMSRFLKFSKDRLVGSSVGFVKPEFFRRVFLEKISSALVETSENHQHATFRPFIDFFRNNKKQLVIVNSVLKLYTTLTNGLKVVVESNPVDFDEAPDSGMAVIDLQNGRLIEWTHQFSKTFEFILRERGMEDENQDLLLNQLFVQIGSFSKTNFLSNQEVQIQFNRQEIYKIPSYKTCAGLFSNIDINCQNVIKAKLITIIKSSDSEYALVRFSYTANDIESDLQDSMNSNKQLTIFELPMTKQKHRPSFMVVKKIDNHKVPPITNKKVSLPISRYRLSIFIFVLLVTLSLRGVIEIFTNSNLEAQINYSRVIVNESKFVTKKITKFISVFDELPLVLFEKEISLSLPEFVTNSTQSRINIATNLDILKINEISYTNLMSLQSREVMANQTGDDEALARELQNKTSVIFLRLVSVKSSENIPLEISFNVYTYYFVEAVKSLLYQRDNVAYVFLKQSLDVLMNDIDNQLTEFSEEKLLKFEKYESEEIALSILNMILAGIFILLIIILSIKFDFSLQKTFHYFFLINKKEISIYLDKINEFRIQLNHDEIYSQEKESEFNDNSLVSDQSDDLFENLGNCNSLFEASWRKNNVSDKNCVKTFTENPSQIQKIVTKCRIYKSRPSRLSYFRILNLLRIFGGLFILIGGILATELACFVKIRSVSSAVSLYSSRFELMSDITTRFYRMRFSTFSSLMEPNCDICFESFKKMNVALLENFQNMKIIFEKNNLSGLEEFVKTITSLNKDICKFDEDFKDSGIDLLGSCDNDQVLTQGFETFIINISDKWIRIFKNSQISNDSAFISQISIHQQIANQILQFLSDSLLTGIESGYSYCYNSAIIIFGVSLAGYVIFGGLSIILVTSRLRTMRWIKKWTLDVIKSETFQKNKPIQEILAQRIKKLSTYLLILYSQR